MQMTRAASPKGSLAILPEPKNDAVQPLLNNHAGRAWKPHSGRRCSATRWGGRSGNSPQPPPSRRGARRPKHASCSGC